LTSVYDIFTFLIFIDKYYQKGIIENIFKNTDVDLAEYIDDVELYKSDYRNLTTYITQTIHREGSVLEVIKNFYMRGRNKKYYECKTDFMINNLSIEEKTLIWDINSKKEESFMKILYKYSV